MVRYAMGTIGTLCLVFTSGFAYVSVGRCWLLEIVALLTQEPRLEPAHCTAWYIGLHNVNLFIKKCIKIST